ncbi:MAG: right-handed parallel beta-helix repeat-containing protein [Alphaproteobacteria bacterium]|nr:right-handed parallel beta-helix repeat-containing protein [Alphaproteobacteria bacterium]
MSRSLMVLALVGCKGNEPPAVPSLAWSAESLAFGDVPEGQESVLPVVFTNEGTGEIGLLSAVVSLGDRDVWQVTWDRAAVLGAGESTSIDVHFRPDDPGERFGGQLHVRTDFDRVPGVFVALEGFGSPSIDDDDADGFTIADGDCDDNDPQRYPGAPERCNGRDDDCSGQPGDDEVDADGDGVRVCAGDCDDDDDERYPGNPEICDQKDNDCDGVVPDDLDQDGDGLSLCQDDCADLDPNVAPGLAEVCDDGRDNDCDGTVDSLDADADGHDACGPAPDCDDSDPLVFPRAVGPSGDDAAAGSWSAPLATLQAALDSTVAGCPNVYLRAGSYDGATSTVPANVVGRGNGPGDVTLGAPAGRVLDLSGGSWSLRNLTVSGGDVAEPGGGVRITGGSLTLRDVVVDGNQATDGGGIAAVGANVLLTGTNAITGNVASGSGGGIHLDGGVLVDVAGAAVTGNTATVAGGGIYAAGTLQLRGTLFDANSTDGSGGGLYVDGGGGHSVQQALFTNDTAIVDGGGLALAGVDFGRFRNNVFTLCTADHGGGVWIDGGGSFTNNTLVDDTAAAGAALYLTGDGAEVRANIAHFNTGDGGFYTDSTAPFATHNTVFGTAGADWVGAWSAGVDENRSENPGFVGFTNDGDPSNDDLSLTAASPSRDSGPPEPAFDDPDGSQNDRGATGGPGAL